MEVVEEGVKGEELIGERMSGGPYQETEIDRVRGY